MDSQYFILLKGFNTNKQGLGKGEFIIKLSKNNSMCFEDGDGPFDSIKALKQKSDIYKNLKRKNPKRADKIFEEKHIYIPNNFIFTPKGESYDFKMIDLFLHCTQGKVERGKVTGIHFYDKEKVKILELLDTNENTKVWRAKIKFYNSKTDKWIKKEKPSDFFPKHWNLTQLFQECNYAYLNKIKIDESDFKYQSRTLTNIKVEIIIKNGIMKSIYPIIE